MGKKEIEKAINDVRLEKENRFKKEVLKPNAIKVKELKGHVLSKGKEISKARESSVTVSADESSTAPSIGRSKGQSDQSAKEESKQPAKALAQSHFMPYKPSASKVVRPMHFAAQNQNQDKEAVHGSQDAPDLNEQGIPESSEDYPPDFGSENERQDLYLEQTNSIPPKVGEDETIKRKELKKLHKGF